MSGSLPDSKVGDVSGIRDSNDSTERDNRQHAYLKSKDSNLSGRTAVGQTTDVAHVFGKQPKHDSIKSEAGTKNL